MVFLAPLLAIAALVVPSATAQFDGLSAAVTAANQSLIWGTYRPNLYFGMRPRLPSSLLSGIMWFGAHDFQSYQKTRHECNQADELVYNFKEHDGRSAAVQVIQDKLNNVELTTSLLKVPGDEHGGSWGVRIQGKPMRPNELSRISLINYFGNDGTLGYLEMLNDEDQDGLTGAIELKGSAHGLGDFRIRIVDDPENPKVTRGPHADDFEEDRLERTHFFAAPVPAGQVWQAKTVLMNAIRINSHEIIKPFGTESPPDPALLFQLPDEIRYGANLYGFQRTYEGTWSVDIYFDSASVTQKFSRESLSAGLAASSLAYNARFDSSFQLPDEYDDAHARFAKELTSNVVGGIGYFHGASLIDRNFAYEWDDDSEIDEGKGREPKPELTGEKQLLTGTPSRSFFPRGFYWDEGFHLQLIGAWDNDLSLEILRDWIELIDEDGWVGREQILGEEARSKVPEEFRSQYPSYGNPPTLAMAVTAYIQRLRDAGITLDDLSDNAEPAEPTLTSAENLAFLHVGSPELARQYLTSIYAKLKRHYEWFRATQRGQIREWGRQARSRSEAYRWRGRSKTHVLTSGLDDYPRAQPPHLGELHVDLISWMGFFAKTMGEIASFLREEDDVAEYQQHYDAIVANIDDLHWSEENQMYCDVSVDEDDESHHVCHNGYVTLFPFLLGLLPADSPRLAAVLEDLHDPEQLWSAFGIRSLSKQDEYYRTGEDYWCSPIWIPINYLALSSLFKVYAAQPGPNQIKAAEIYAELRKNVVDAVYEEYKRTGVTWEQYNDETGRGQRTNPFTGWTAMIALIMAEKY